jgi:hypothetical protein
MVNSKSVSVRIFIKATTGDRAIKKLIATSIVADPKPIIAIYLI